MKFTELSDTELIDLIQSDAAITAGSSMATASQVDIEDENSNNIQNAFDELISRYEVKVYGLAMDLTGIEVSASSVVQDVFVELFNRLTTESTSYSQDEFEQMLHGITYDFSLRMLICGGGPSKQSFHLDSVMYSDNLASNNFSIEGSVIADDEPIDDFEA